MNVIKKTSEYEEIVKKSKFISFLYFVKSIDEVNNYLNELKAKYKDASHICYAYIVDNNVKYNDDKEPSKTAGFPILNVLKNNDLNYVLAVVVRYFGGIKLGSGNLLRTYLNVTNENLKKTGIKEYKLKKEYIIICNYDNVNYVNNVLKDEDIVNKTFDNFITYEILIDNENIIKIKDLLNNKNIEIKEKKN
ncbi:MAG: YigZ family protein [Tenericutes bacterium]|nr:YigZ family protein [Mycoplasmatota bacterium]